jgi:hypothetical protein
VAASSVDKTEPRVTVWQEFVIFGVTLAACLILVTLGAPDRWFDAIFVTVGSFGAAISYCKTSWPSRRFWITLTGALVAHLALLWLIFTVILRQPKDFGFVVCVPVVLVESSLIYYVIKFFGGLVPPRSSRGRDI